MTDNFIAGLIGGSVGVTGSYAWSTIKTRSQNASAVGSRYSAFADLRANGIRQFYRGFSVPLIGAAVEKSVLFWAYGTMQSQNRNNDPTTDLIDGMSAGVLTSLVVNPYERIMIGSQVDRVRPLTVVRRIISREGIAGFGRGWSATVCREVPGYGVYFMTWNACQRNVPLDNNNPLKVLVSGAASGVAAWTVIYPIDPIKTTMQQHNIGAIDAVIKIHDASGLRGFVIGMQPALVRAAILHAGVFGGVCGYRALLARTTGERRG